MPNYLKKKKKKKLWPFFSFLTFYIDWFTCLWCITLPKIFLYIIFIIMYNTLFNSFNKPYLIIWEIKSVVFVVFFFSFFFLLFLYWLICMFIEWFKEFLMIYIVYFDIYLTWESLFIFVVNLPDFYCYSSILFHVFFCQIIDHFEDFDNLFYINLFQFCFDWCYLFLTE